ncbi:uncharacterized protein TRAVEDRAFT_65420 [Trametes versicolor FP-101664 SS1]|uniref:uncharacterized protein n=1 Tax=Trametes versicolor (strain FP-101664) TaxID=717944 RepID=UPI00046222BD|nr:uncharacterized protein TRAVEDRAFT_65420 [Trametes versicolor FP-101664 SS1]EIW57690.1 hypothetical protein TRAVEDRAFT_65420 [Trametes versicolor FP-101664 SS1]
MSSNNENSAPRSLPIPIGGRRRSGSVSEGSSSSDSGSVSPASPLQTPASGTLPRIAPITPGTSPILSYFLSQSPKSPTAATYPFRRGMAPPVYEDDEEFEPEKPITRHGRSASTAWPAGDRYAAPAVPPVGHQQDRAAGLLRRLSLGGNMARPQIPVPKPVNGSGQAPRSTTPPGMKSPSAGSPMRKARRSNTMAAGTPRPPRAPSPMGERILKGHFDGFN